MSARLAALMRPSLLALAALTVALLVTAASASAATVTNTSDSGPGSLRQLVADAKPGDTITIPPGRVDLTSGQILIEKDLTIAGAGAETTTVSANKASRIFRIDGAATDVTISGLTLRDGVLVDREALFGESGAAILSSGESLTLRGDVLTRNFINARAVEGVAVTSLDRRLTIVDTAIVDNTGQANGDDGKDGGLVFGGAVTAANGAARIERTTIADNTMEALGGQSPSAAGEQEGGSIFGAGIAIFVDGSYELVDSTISGNVGRTLGGPGSADGSVEGGGVFAFGTAPKQRIFNTTITGNAALAGTGVASGGGLMLSSFFASAPKPEVIGATIVANEAEGDDAPGNGGNVAVQPRVEATFLDTIVANGTGRAGGENCAVIPAEVFEGEEPDEEGKIVSLGFNLDSRDQCGFGAAGDLTETNPLLGPLAENGGPTLTLAPAADSPVVDAGAAGLPTDQRGLPRPVDLANPNSAADGADGSDIGAVELQD